MIELSRAFVMFFLLCAVPVWADDRPYRLGPEDLITLRVVVWDDRAAAYQTMEAIAGEYSVSADGELAIPIVGRIDVMGLSLDELSSMVSEKLKSSAGLFQRPVVAAQIATYRPFFILGSVEKPGGLAWRPELTVSKALALAGGIALPQIDIASEKSILRDVNSLRSVQVELVRLRAREARLMAELENQTEIDFPKRLTHPDGEQALLRVIAEEQSIFDIRRGSQDRNRASNEDLIALHRTELTGLQGKLEGTTRQLRIAQEQVENLRSLVERGTVVANRLISAERSLTDLSAEELDLNTAIFRAQQRISETKRDVLQAADNARNDATVQLQETRRRLELEGKREALFIGLIYESGTKPIGIPLDTQLQVRRAVDGVTQIITVDMDTKIQPGDVLEVSVSVDALPQ